MPRSSASAGEPRIRPHARTRRGRAAHLPGGPSPASLTATSPRGYSPDWTPILVWKSAVVFSCGNSSLGTSSPSAEQIGSHPSPGRQSISRSAGTSRRTSPLCRSYAAVTALASGHCEVRRVRTARRRDQSGRPGRMSPVRDGTIVLSTLAHHVSGESRLERRITASGGVRSARTCGRRVRRAVARAQA